MRRPASGILLLACFAVMPLGVQLGFSQDPETDAAPLQAGSDPPTVRGSLSLRYRLRATNHDSEQDLYGHLGVALGDRLRDPFSAYLQVRGTADIDGHRDRTGFFVFDGLSDTYDDSINGRVYTAYVDARRIDFLTTARVGRQFTHETPETFHFDGVRVRTQAFPDFLDLELGAYGGQTVHLHESSPDGDWIAGVSAGIRPWSGGRIRADYVHVRDDARFGTERNDLFGIALRQRLLDRVLVTTRYSRLEESSRDVDLRATYLEPDLGLQVDVSYYELLKTQRQLANEFDPFFNTLFELLPYRQLGANLHKTFGDHVSMALGYSRRELDRSSQEATFNHDFERVYASPALRDWPWKGFESTATFDAFDDDDNTTRTLSGEIAQTFSEELRLALGTSYSLYKYDFFFASERDHLRTYYVDADWRLTKAVRLRCSYGFEDDPFDQYHTFDTRLVLSF